MADFKQNYFQRRTKDRGPRSNNRISSPEVQVIASDGVNLGVLSTNEAISIAKNQGLDLIEIAPNANPPVCTIMDMGKFKYDAQKKIVPRDRDDLLVSVHPLSVSHDRGDRERNIHHQTIHDRLFSFVFERRMYRFAVGVSNPDSRQRSSNQCPVVDALEGGL